VKIQGQFTSGTSSITQKAAVAAVNADPAVVTNMREAFHQRRDLLLSLMKDVPNVKSNNPGGAFYLFPEVSHYFGKRDGDTVIKDARELCMYILNKFGVFNDLIFINRDLFKLIFYENQNGFYIRNHMLIFIYFLLFFFTLVKIVNYFICSDYIII
jgi:hypothetical protein